MGIQAAKLFHELSQRKVNAGSDPIVMITAYDSPSARFARKGGADIILVGDSAANVMLGYESTMSIASTEMLMLVSAVARSGTTLPIVADMVWGSYHVSREETLHNAIDLVHAGAHAVKLEGGQECIGMIHALVNAHIPVIGHIGLTPQSILEMGSYRVQGTDSSRAQQLLKNAQELCEAGVSMLVVECVPDVLGRIICEEVSVPVIGIGAGRHVDGQVLVMHDVLGIGDEEQSKFIRRFAHMEEEASNAVQRYALSVRQGTFPSSDETYHMSEDVVSDLEKLQKSSMIRRDI